MINAFRFGVVGPPEPPQLELITSKGSLPLAQSFNGSGSIIVAHDDKANGDAGSVSVFEWSGTTWNQKGQTINGNTDAENGPFLNNADRLKSGRLSYDGTRLLTLAPGDSATNNEGKAQAYEYNQSNNTWETLGQEFSGLNSGDNLGKVGFMSADGESITLYTGDTDQSIQRYGLVAGTSWSSTSQEALAGISLINKTVLMTPDLEYLVYTGIAETTAAGATVYKYNPPSGTSFISPGRYQQRGSSFPDTVDNPVCTSISPDGVRLVISDNIGTNDAGRVRVYEWVETDWVQIGQDIVGLSTQPPPSDGGGSRLGYTTAINGDNLLIGEKELNFDNINNSTFGGAVKYYKYNETTDEFELKWVADGLIDNLDDLFGSFIELSPDGSTFMAAGGFNKNRFIYDLNTATTASYFIPIGNIGNTAATPSPGYGAVSYNYAISRYVVSNFDISSYNADPLNSTRQIYIPDPAGATPGERNADIPARINWNNAARYVNWLNIQEGVQPAYRFLTEGAADNITLWDVADSWTAGGENRYRHKDTKYFIPSEDEWYKAAYHKNDGDTGNYWSYPTGSDTPPVATGSFEEGSTTQGEAVYNDGVIDPVPTAAIDVTNAGGLSPYGTMGQGGNIWEWNESNYDGTNDDPSGTRSLRGGRWDSDSTKLRYTFTGRTQALPDSTNFTNNSVNGLRVAKTIAPPVELVTIGDAGNVADTTTYGAVPYEYRISKYAIRETDIDDYNAAPANAGTLQITLVERGDNKPATSVSWNEAARYINWLNIKEGKQPAYKFDTGIANDNISLWDVADSWTAGGENRYRHKDTKYFLPNENEWYKAAYYDPINTVYYDYPTGSDSAPTTTSGGTALGTAIYRDGVNPNPPGPADVDQAGGLSPYGTMGQGGNTFEWIESAFNGTNDFTTENRVIRGGNWSSSSFNLQSSNRTSSTPGNEGSTIGFRVAAVPE